MTSYSSSYSRYEQGAAPTSIQLNQSSSTSYAMSGGGMSSSGMGGMSSSGLGSSSSSSFSSSSKSGSMAVVASARKTDISASTHASVGHCAKCDLTACGSSSGTWDLAIMGSGEATFCGVEHQGNPSSVIQARLKEKDALNNLNEKLAQHLSKDFVGPMMREQEALIEKIRVRYVEMERKLAERYDHEMNKMRGTIDATARGTSEMKLELENIKTLYKDLEMRYQAEVTGHEVTRHNLFEKEKELTQIRGHYDVLKVTLEKIEPQVKTLKEQISVYQKNSIDSKLALDSEVVRRVELQSTIETKDEEIAFIRRTYEEKIMFLMEFDLDVGSDKIEAEMAIAIRDIRAEYQAQLESLKVGSDDSWYQQKFLAMMNASEKSDKELLEWKNKVSILKTEMSAMSVSAQSREAAMSVQLKAFEAKCSALEADLSSERNAHASALAAKNAEINALKMEFMETRQLMDKTQFFDAEIATYQRLLRIGHRDCNLCKVVTCNDFPECKGEQKPQPKPQPQPPTAWVTSTTTTTKTTTSLITESERANYLATFKRFDHNNTEKISGSELKLVFEDQDRNRHGGRLARNATQEYCDSIMKVADTDHNLLLDFEEFLRLMTYEKKVFAKQIFVSADKDKSGFLSVTEIQDGMAAAGFEIDGQSSAGDIIKRMKTTDGKVNFEELAALL